MWQGLAPSVAYASQETAATFSIGEENENLDRGNKTRSKNTATGGSMRDRFPISQTDWMKPSGGLAVTLGRPALGGRVAIRGHDNACLIRSGQDWA